MRRVRTRRWVWRLAYVLIALIVTLAMMLPLGAQAGDWPGPDLLLCITLAWTVRRPNMMVAPLIAAVLLAEDVLLMRPPGLWTAIVLLGSEVLRSRVALARELNFLTEWLAVSALMVGMELAYRFVFAMVFLPQVALGYAMLKVTASILCYPVVVLVSTWMLGLHKPATGEIDAYGRRM
ncbi:rod shape-determining protein MreD [Falsirhodobacter algicola]|nr:rod shape-determining protein MreD [Falsirhodobacter algicola]